VLEVEDCSIIAMGPKHCLSYKCKDCEIEVTREVILD